MCFIPFSDYSVPSESAHDTVTLCAKSLCANEEQHTVLTSRSLRQLQVRPLQTARQTRLLKSWSLRFDASGCAKLWVACSQLFPGFSHCAWRSAFKCVYRNALPSSQHRKNSDRIKTCRLDPTWSNLQLCKLPNARTIQWCYKPERQLQGQFEGLSSRIQRQTWRAY